MRHRFAPRNPGHESWRHKVRRPDGVVVLASGGLDSCVLVAHLARRGRTVFPLFVRAGMVWENAELAALRRFLQALPPPLSGRVETLKVVSCGLGHLYGSHWSTTGQGVPLWDASDDRVYLPGRNVMLISAAAVHAALLGVPRVALGPLRGNPFPDASRPFFSAMRRAVSEGLDFPIRLETPFLDKEKEDVIRLGEDLPLHLTFSCSRPRGGRPCRRCAKCRERILALRDAAPGPTRRAAAR